MLGACEQVSGLSLLIWYSYDIGPIIVVFRPKQKSEGAKNIFKPYIYNFWDLERIERFIEFFITNSK